MSDDEESDDELSDEGQSDEVLLDEEDEEEELLEEPSFSKRTPSSTQRWKRKMW